MPNSTYWKKRFSQLEASQNQFAQQTFRDIQVPFDKAQAQIQSHIETWYARYAKNNQISMQEARKILTNTELKELKWDVQEYIKYGKENSITQEWIKELENASAKFHISRLEALKLRTQNAYEMAFGNETDAIDGMMKRMYQSGYYHTCFEVQKGFNLGWEIGQIDENKLSKIVSKPWASDGKNFSDRIWTQKTSMVNQLHQELTRNIIQGKAPDEAIKHMTKYVADKTKNAKNAAGRLVMTESAFISSAAQKDAFNDLDVEQFEIVATLDSHTSEICQNMDGQHFPMKDFEAGVTAPPFHVYCRSTTVPYFNDEWSGGERAARGEDGKTYYVDADMEYPEWKNSFVDSVDDNSVKTHLEEIDVEYMSNSFKPQYGDEITTKLDDITFTVKSVENSELPLVVDVDYTRRTKAVRLTEKNLTEINRKLPNDFDMPEIMVVDFEKYGLNQNAIGGYHAESGIMFINGKYDTSGKILSFINKESGWFANQTVYAPYLHEFGHKYFEDSIKLLVESKKMLYNKARMILEERISEYIHTHNLGDNLEKVISGYANSGYKEHSYGEIVAECFTVADSNKTAADIIKLVR